MKRKDIWNLISTFAMPVTLVLLGAVLLLSPDSASILIAKLIGWLLCAGGVIYGIFFALLGESQKQARRFITAIACFLLGGLLLANPLLLARNLGRFLGILLAMEGGQIIFKGVGSKGLGVIMIFGARVLVFAPMTASRLVFSLCGLLLICIGGAELLEKLRKKKLNPGKEKPDIIDAE